jgi:transposase-like protein
MQKPASSAEKAPNTKHPGGRPTIYRPELGQMLISAMATGLSAEAAAAKIGIGARTLFTWQQQHPEFQQAVQEGRHQALLYWEQRAIAIANGKAGNAQLVTLALKNRSRAASGWHHDVLKTELTGADGGAIQTEVKTTIDATALAPEARAALRAAILAAKGSG